MSLTVKICLGGRFMAGHYHWPCTTTTAMYPTWHVPLDRKLDLLMFANVCHTNKKFDPLFFFSSVPTWGIIMNGPLIRYFF